MRMWKILKISNYDESYGGLKSSIIFFKIDPIDKTDRYSYCRLYGNISFGIMNDYILRTAQ